MLDQTSDAVRLNQTVFPQYATFRDSCERGLSVVYPFRSKLLPDANCWKFGHTRPPSHPAFGRMRSLLAVVDARQFQAQRILEVAAGGGGLAATLANSAVHVTVNDIREGELREALHEFESADRIRIIGGNLFDLSPLQTGQFDLIVACEVIEHVAHPVELLQHLRGLLRPGGRLLLTTPNGSYFRNNLPTFSQIESFAELECRQFKPDADGHLFLLTPGELFDVALSAGLEVERINVWGTPFLTGHAGLRLLGNRLMTKAAYGIEVLTQLLPSFARECICFAMCAILQNKSQT